MNPQPYLTAQDEYLYNEGNHFRIYDRLGAHPIVQDGVAGTYFAVWAPNANYVSVVGDFNYWSNSQHPLTPQGASGIWAGFVPGARHSQTYKYYISCKYHHHTGEKTDPVGFHHEIAPKTASVIWDLDYTWNDTDWMSQRHQRNSLTAPISIYEVHLGSWKRVPHDGNRSLNYREMAHELADYCHFMGFTHVEFLPITEHPFFGSWGYQTTGYFAPTSRFGTPQDFMYLVDYLHQRNLGVILDWVPSHFPNDAHGLAYFDGTHLYEHQDPREGFHPDWKSAIFNYGRHEVRSFLISSALFWLDKYHIDGLRVDAVASMLYRDYSRQPGQWVPNVFGGNENLEATAFLRRFNEEVFRSFPDVQTYAEESTSWPGVSKPTYLGGLGFGLKWDMGWMHDTLRYFGYDPLYRYYHHNELLFRMQYAFSENFVLPLSHDEVVHLKGSLVKKMSGDDWQKFANLRTLYGYMYGQPGKKLLFMGSELASWEQWHHDSSLDWHLTGFGPHKGMQQWVADLNHLYKNEPAMWQNDLGWNGFQWIDCNDAMAGVISFMRIGRTPGEEIVGVMNLTPVPKHGYQVGLPHGGTWSERLNSDAKEYWGSGSGNSGAISANAGPWQNQPYSALLTLPPLSMLYFKWNG
jgi:1,4-alpha-glucan branching enzyme